MNTFLNTRKNGEYLLPVMAGGDYNDQSPSLIYGSPAEITIFHWSNEYDAIIAKVKSSSDERAAWSLCRARYYI